MLGFIGGVQGPIHSQGALYVPGTPKTCVWTSFYDVHVNRIKRVQRKFIRFALRGLWDGLICTICLVMKTDVFDVLPCCP
jgi:hypothetical protein